MGGGKNLMDWLVQKHGGGWPNYWYETIKTVRSRRRRRLLTNNSNNNNDTDDSKNDNNK